MDKELKLNVLLELTKAINANLPDYKLIKLLEVIFKIQLAIPAGLLLVKKNNVWVEDMRFGTPESFKVAKLPQDIFSTSDIKILLNDGKVAIDFFNVLVPVYHDVEAAAFLFLKDKQTTDAFEVSHIVKNLHFIQTLLSLVVVAIKNKMLTREVIEKEKFFHEMKLATEVQRMLIPAQIPLFKNIDIHSIYLPHSRLSGDYFDFIQLNKNELLISLADVSGKGISAALLMASAQSFLKAIVKYTNNLSEMLIALNKQIFEYAKGERFISIFLAKYNTEDKTLSYINLGHPYPFLLNNNKCVALESNTFPIGVVEDIYSLRVEKIKILPKAILCCYTDGLVEIEKNIGELFNENNIKQILIGNNYGSVAELNNVILNTIIDFKEDKNFTDDITLFSMQFG